MKKYLRGAALAEYAVILAVILVGAVLALSFMGDAVTTAFGQAADEVALVGKSTE